MVPNRLLILLGAGFLSASAAWADGVAYVDCASHPEETQVFAKPRRTPDAVAAIPCGERFTLLLNGFIFSRVQTRDGQIGYVYSNVISMDRSGAAVPGPTATRLSASAAAPAATPKPAEVKAAEIKPTEVKAAEVKPSAARAAETKPAGVPAAVEVPAQQPSARAAQPAANSANTVSANAQGSASASGANAQPVSAQGGAQPQVQVPATATTAAEVTATPAQPQTGGFASREQLEAMAAASLNAAHPENSEAPAATSQPEAATSSAAPQPENAASSASEANAAAQPEPRSAEPAAPAVRAEKARERWERPNAGGRRFIPLFELYGGYAFTRFDTGAGATTNFNGVLGSFGWNFKPWLQLVADSSYSVVTVTGVKNVLYGNHWGPRLFLRGHGKWSVTPFVEGLVGGTRADTTVSGVAGYSTSENTISYKVGGGLDIKPSRHLEIRLLNVDYYRTSFGPNVHQNNYWASAGIVLRLFGGTE